MPETGEHALCMAPASAASEPYSLGLRLGGQVVECPLKCGTEQIWFKDLVSHQQLDCPNRLSRCPLKCPDVILKRDLDDHVNHHCQLRVVACPYVQLEVAGLCGFGCLVTVCVCVCVCTNPCD